MEVIHSMFVGEYPKFLMDESRHDDFECLPAWFVDILMTDGFMMDFEFDVDDEREATILEFNIEGWGCFRTITLPGGLALTGLIKED